MTERQREDYLDHAASAIESMWSMFSTCSREDWAEELRLDGFESIADTWRNNMTKEEWRRP